MENFGNRGKIGGICFRAETRIVFSVGIVDEIVSFCRHPTAQSPPPPPRFDLPSARVSYVGDGRLRFVFPKRNVHGRQTIDRTRRRRTKLTDRTVAPDLPKTYISHPRPRSRVGERG